MDLQKFLDGLAVNETDNWHHASWKVRNKSMMNPEQGFCEFVWYDRIIVVSDKKFVSIAFPNKFVGLRPAQLLDGFRIRLLPDNTICPTNVQIMASNSHSSTNKHSLLELHPEKNEWTIDPIPIAWGVIFGSVFLDITFAEPNSCQQICIGGHYGFLDEKSHRQLRLFKGEIISGNFRIVDGTLTTSLKN